MVMRGQRKQLGAEAEQLAAAQLEESGCRILARNWRCRTGELDIVAESEGRIVFVEVRSRRLTGSYGTPQESVTFHKQRQVRETAQRFLAAHRMLDTPVRFDVMAVLFTLDKQLVRIDHLRGAF
jgi:putative endonuclease